jgi:uncharacterized protein YyaL (SSP411 family)
MRLFFPCLTLLAAASGAFASSPLSGSVSSFVRTQADSAVQWQPWNAAVLGRARAENKPVYVFIGSSLSELSRATCRQTFARAETAAFLNEHFLCVLVDREEQPDVAAYAQFYLKTVKQTGGWPAHLWLTPELQPFEGAGYLPPNEEWGKPSFMKIAQQAESAWATNPAGCRTRADAATAQLAAPASPVPAADASKEKPADRLAAAAAAWRAQFDATHGGFGDPPKHPEPELLRFLLRQSPADRDAALATLRAIAGSALRDPLDGGFFRYAIDAAWNLPYPQKTLADQARLALAFLDAAKTGSADADAFAGAARGALDYALNRLALADGTFAASEDATDDAQVGYYAWTAGEIDKVLGADAAAFKTAHGVATDGNVSADDDLSGRYHGKNLLRSVLAETAPDRAASARLLAVRDRRPAPVRDERATAGAHGLLIAALARGGAQLGEPRYLAAATRTLEAVKKEFLLPSDPGLRRLRDSSFAAAPADYAALALGARELAHASGQAEAGELAGRLLTQMNARFFDAARGGYDATPAQLPVGIAARPPAQGDAPSAAPLALRAGVASGPAKALAAALEATVETDGPPASGDVLLALAVAGQ